MAFSLITNEYFKARKSDFYNSDDSNPIIIKVKLSINDIPSLNYFDSEGKKCGFNLIVRKTQTGKYVKSIKLYNDADVDYEILREEEKVPNIYMIPLIRIDDLYSDWLSVGISKFIESEDKYSALMVESKEKIKSSMISKVVLFRNFCKKFNQDFDIELTEPKITDEKVYIVNGDKEHNYSIGSGYKSIANIILNTMDEKQKYEYRDLLRKFNHAYSYITQIVRINDKELFKEFMFISYLINLLPKDTAEKISIDDKINLEFAKLKETYKGSIELEKTSVDLKPEQSVDAKRKPKSKDTLQSIIDKVNEQYMGQFTDSDKVIISGIFEMFMNDPEVKKYAQYAKENNPEMFI